MKTALGDYLLASHTPTIVIAEPMSWMRCNSSFSVKYDIRSARDVDENPLLENQCLRTRPQSSVCLSRFDFSSTSLAQVRHNDTVFRFFL